MLVFRVVLGHIIIVLTRTPPTTKKNDASGTVTLIRRWGNILSQKTHHQFY